MNKRIKTIASYINKSDLVADIGCDQALLSIHLAFNGISSIASDIRVNIIEKCKEKITKLNLEDFIKLRVGDGIEKINSDEADTLILSGMGTYTILKIIENSESKFKKIITISNNNHKILRERMHKLGYKILLEEIIYEKKKYYNLIIFIPGNTKYTLSELNIGKNHQNKSILKKYNEELINKYTKIYEKSNDVNIKELIEIIKNYKY